MTCGDSAPEGLRPQLGADGSFSLFSERFAEGFHAGAGALSEAWTKFVQPAQLERFIAGQKLRVVDVGFGLGTNSAALWEAAEARGLELEIWGLECDPHPLRLALAAPAFRRQWQANTVLKLENLLAQGRDGNALLLWGDGRRQLPELLGERQLAGQCDLVLLDAFSPQHCPELWSLEFLGKLALLLKPQGRLLTYCCAAAVRHSLRLAGLKLASIQPPPQLGGGGMPGATAPPPAPHLWWTRQTAVRCVPSRQWSWSTSTPGPPSPTATPVARPRPPRSWPPASGPRPPAMPPPPARGAAAGAWSGPRRFRPSHCLGPCLPLPCWPLERAPA
jgi:tRNA U34 5-methylaminomethyl-2-thiouridine-forming methyltransferase MnmC